MNNETLVITTHLDHEAHAGCFLGGADAWNRRGAVTDVKVETR